MENQTSFLFALNGVIVGMALAKIISGYASYIEKQQNYKFYWVHFLLSLIVFILLAQYWFVLLGWEIVGKNYWIYLASLLYPLSLYLIASLLMPKVTERLKEKECIDLEEHYYRNRKWIYGIVIFDFFYLFICVLLSSENLLSIVQFLRILGFSFVPFLFIKNNRKIHAVGVVAIFICLLAIMMIDSL